LFVNSVVPLLLSRISQRHEPVDAPMPTLRLARPPEPAVPPPPLLAAAPAATQPAVAQIDVPALDIPPLPTSASLITLPVLTTHSDSASLPFVVPAIAVTGNGNGASLLPSIGDAEVGYDQAPQRISDLDMDRFYPRLARQRGITGTSVIQLVISETGDVIAVEVVSSTPAGVFDKALIDLGRSQRFLPARQGNRPVRALWPMTITWTITR
jgi:protein TonB